MTLPLMTQPVVAVAAELVVALQSAATKPVAFEAVIEQTFPGRSWAAVALG